MSHPDFAKAAPYVTAENVRTLLMDLVDISSPTGQEIGVAQYLVARMKKSACVLNVARGGIIDEQALADALAAGTIAGAGVDVFTAEPIAATAP